MNEFMLWFWRPFAEVLGVLALLLLVSAVVFVLLLAKAFVVKAKKLWRARFKKESA